MTSANDLLGTAGPGLDALNGLVAMPSIKNGGFQNPGDKLVGTVAFDVTDADVRVATEYGTSTPKVDRNGRTQYQMSIVLDVIEWTDPELIGTRARIYAEGSKLRSIVNAVQKAGHRAPEAGARIELTYTESRKTGSGFPAKIFTATYTPNYVGSGEHTQAVNAAEMAKVEHEIQQAPDYTNRPVVPAQPGPAAAVQVDTSQFTPEQMEQFRKMTGQA